MDFPRRIGTRVSSPRARNGLDNPCSSRSPTSRTDSSRNSGNSGSDTGRGRSTSRRSGTASRARPSHLVSAGAERGARWASATSLESTVSNSPGPLNQVIPNSRPSGGSPGDLLEKLQEGVRIPAREGGVLERAVRRFHVLLDRRDRLLEDADDLLPRRVPEQGREGDGLPASDYQASRGQMHHVHAGTPALDLPLHRAGDGLFQEGLRGTALGDEAAVLAEEDDPERVRGLPGSGEVPPERGLEGESPEATPEGSDPLEVRMDDQLLERRLDLLRLRGLQEMAERRELLLQGREFRARAALPSGGCGGFRALVGLPLLVSGGVRPRRVLLVDHVDGLGEIHVRVGEHRVEDVAPVAPELPLQDPQRGVLLLLRHAVPRTAIRAAIQILSHAHYQAR